MSTYVHKYYKFFDLYNKSFMETLYCRMNSNQTEQSAYLCNGNGAGVGLGVFNS